VRGEDDDKDQSSSSENCGLKNTRVGGKAQLVALSH